MNKKLFLLLNAVAIPIILIVFSLVLLKPQPVHSAASSSVSWTDNFSSSTLNSQWSWIREDDTHWSLTNNPGFMNITTQSGGVRTGNNLLVRTAPAGNFEIETHVFFTPTEDFQFAGLLMYQDDDSYMLLGREYCGYTASGCVENGIYFNHVEDGWLFDENYAMTTTLTGEAYLKVSRLGDLYKGYVSENGSNWVEVGAHTTVSGFVPAYVGLAALNQSDITATLDADFDYFQLKYDTVITIGVAAPLSGGVEFIGWPVANAVQLAISQTNEAGGVNLGGITYTLAMVAADDQCIPTQAITVANTLVDAGVSAIVGHVCSGASFQGQPIYSAANIPMISPSSTHPGLTQQGYTNTFRTISTDLASPNRLATHFRTWLTLPKVAIVEGPDTPGDWAVDAFSETFTSLGGAITSWRQVTETAQFTATLTALQAEDPDAIYFVDIEATNAGLFSRTAHNSSMSDVIIGWNSWDNFDDNVLDTYIAWSGEAAAENDHIALQSRRVDDMPGWISLNNAYLAAGFPNYGDTENPYIAFAYDAANIVIEALQRAGYGSPSAIRNEIAATQDFDGAVGSYVGFDEYGDVIPQWAWMEVYLDGEWYVINATRSFLPVIIRE